MPDLSELSIISSNVQGLGNFQKRRDVFNYLRQKKHSIYFLQDTHFVSKQEKQIRAEWGYECFFSSYTSQSRGVAILFNNTFQFSVKEIISDPYGNYLILLINTSERNIVLVNLYGPNNDSPQFYSTLQEKLEQIPNDGIIIGGDWNLVLNPTLDYHNYKHNNNTRAQDRVIRLAGELELVDIWREINPEILRYTWRRPTPRQQARLDFFLISEELTSYVKDTNILPGYRSDHSIVSTKFDFRKEQKTRNFWKFNSSLLKDNIFVSEINEVIKEIKEQYAAFVYKREAIEDIPLDLLHLTISDQLFLDILLMEIRKKTLDYSYKKKKRDKLEEQQIEEQIRVIEKKTLKSEKNSRNDRTKRKISSI